MIDLLKDDCARAACIAALRKDEPYAGRAGARTVTTWSAHCADTAEARAHAAFSELQQLKREYAALLSDAKDMAQHMRIVYNTIHMPMHVQYAMQRYHPDVLACAKRER